MPYARDGAFNRKLKWNGKIAPGTALIISIHLILAGLFMENDPINCPAVAWSRAMSRKGLSRVSVPSCCTDIGC
jgi:hypothetical protein